MKPSSIRLPIVILAGLLLCMLAGCEDDPSTLTLTVEYTPIGAAGTGTWYAVEDGALTCWGEVLGSYEYINLEYDQRDIVFNDAACVWGYRFGTLVLDKDGGLWTSSASGFEDAVQQGNWSFLLSDVVSASGDVWNGAAVCSDGSLWTWGPNSHGRLANGETDETFTFYPPQHIMDGVCKVREASYAITCDGTLYGLGIWDDCLEPVQLCENVADVSSIHRGIQVLFRDGTLCLFDLLEEPGQTKQIDLGLTNIASVFYNGYCTEDGNTHFWNVWEGTELSDASTIRVPIKTQFCVNNPDGYLIMTADGALYQVNLEKGSFRLTPLGE